jgi:hypothetical protein
MAIEGKLKMTATTQQAQPSHTAFAQILASRREMGLGAPAQANQKPSTFARRFDQAVKIFDKSLVVAKVITAPVWIPLWIMMKILAVLLPLLVLGFLSGCTSTSNHFDKSPCACEFRPLNTAEVEDRSHA